MKLRSNIHPDTVVHRLFEYHPRQGTLHAILMTINEMCKSVPTVKWTRDSIDSIYLVRLKRGNTRKRLKNVLQDIGVLGDDGSLIESTQGLWSYDLSRYKEPEQVNWECSNSPDLYVQAQGDAIHTVRGL